MKISHNTESKLVFLQAAARALLVRDFENSEKSSIESKKSYFMLQLLTKSYKRI